MSHNSILLILLPVFATLVAERWIYFKILKIAKDKNLVDKPDSRKLQKAAVPVVGGLTVFFGLMAGLLTGSVLCSMFMDGLPPYPMAASLSGMLLVVLCMGIMLYTGFLDDMAGLSPKIRFLIEILVLLLLVLSTGVSINSLHGLWGVEHISGWIAVPLTVFAGVGVINAINMMDGVNGLSSGICIACSVLGGIHFVYNGDWGNALLALCTAASLMLFFVHNVFGSTSKMFIGDAGTMAIGTLMAWFMTCIMYNPHFSYVLDYNLCPTAMVVALFSVPVADTLRVMTMRMLNGRSPFCADKNHLHHAFVGLGISHGFTTFWEIFIDFLIVAIWILSVLLGASLEMQLYTVIVASAILVWGTYYALVHKKKSNSNTLIC